MQQQGNLVMCITAGVFLGIGLGPLFNSMLIGLATGTTLGLAAGLWFSRKKSARKPHH